MKVNIGLRSEISRYVTKEKELENINQMLKDEHQALQLAFASLEDKLRKAQVNHHIPYVHAFFSNNLYIVLNIAGRESTIGGSFNKIQS